MSTSATGPDIYNYPRRLQLALQNLQNNAKISARNRRLIMAFHERSTAEGLSTPRLVRYIHILSKLAQELGKSFETARREDIIHLVAEIENRPLSDWTKLSYKLVLKKFYKWLRHSKGYPKEVDWIKTPSRIRNSILPADLLTEDDIKRLVSVATTPRDKALILTLYDSGARIGELLSLRIRNVEFDKYGAVFVVTGKTGMRRVRIIMSTPGLGEWLNVHPNRGNPDSPLWVGEGRGGMTPLRYEAVRALIQRLEWSDLFSELGLALRTATPNRNQRLALTILKLAITEPLLTSALGHPPTVYHLAKATDESVTRVYRLLNDPTLGLALGLQKSTLSEPGLAKVSYDDLTFPVEKLVGVRRTKDRREGPLSLYRMARYVPQSPSGMSPEDMSAMREFVAEVLLWATSGLKFLHAGADECAVDHGSWREIVQHIDALSATAGASSTLPRWRKKSQ